MSANLPLAFPKFVTLQQIVDGFTAAGINVTPHIIRRSAALGRFPAPLLLGDRLEIWREDEVLRAVTGQEPPTPPEQDEMEPHHMDEDIPATEPSALDDAAQHGVEA